MFTKETCTNILKQYEQLTDELERILKIMDCYSRNITSVEMANDFIHVSYEDYCMGTWGHNDTYIPFNLIGATEDDIKSFVTIKNAQEKAEQEERYKNEQIARELKQLKELSQKYPNAM